MSDTKAKAALLASENGCLRAELAQAKRDIKDWQDSSEAYRLDAERAEARVAELELREKVALGAHKIEWERAERVEAECKSLREALEWIETKAKLAKAGAGAFEAHGILRGIAFAARAALIPSPVGEKT